MQVVVDTPAGGADAVYDYDARGNLTKVNLIDDTDIEESPKRRVGEIVSQSLTRQPEDIAVAAYFKAEKRGFEPGHDVEDWLEAETELTENQD